jgi:hypothetical protein
MSPSFSVIEHDFYLREFGFNGTEFDMYKNASSQWTVIG